MNAERYTIDDITGMMIKSPDGEWMRFDQNQQDHQDNVSETFALLNELGNQLSLPAGTPMQDVVRHVLRERYIPHRRNITNT